MNTRFINCETDTVSKQSEKRDIPRCPKCGEPATYQTPDGTYWDSSAHYWREPNLEETEPRTARGGK